MGHHTITPPDQESGPAPILPDRSDLGSLYVAPKSPQQNTPTDEELPAHHHDALLQIVEITIFLSLPIIACVILIQLFLHLPTLEYYHLSLIGLAGVSIVFWMYMACSSSLRKLDRLPTSITPSRFIVLYFLLLIPLIKLLGEYIVSDAALAVIVLGWLALFITGFLLFGSAALEITDTKKKILLFCLFAVSYSAMLADTIFW